MKKKHKILFYNVYLFFKLSVNSVEFVSLPELFTLDLRTYTKIVMKHFFLN